MTENEIGTRVIGAAIAMHRELGPGRLANPRRGIYQITPRGQEVLVKPPAAWNLRFLRQFPEYQAFRATHRQRPDEPDEAETNHGATPEESLETAYAKIRHDLAVGIHNVGVSTITNYELKKIDTDYFTEE